MVPPSQFIPVAEDAGLIHELTLWLLDEACRQLAAWRAALLGYYMFSSYFFLFFNIFCNFLIFCWDTI